MKKNNRTSFWIGILIVLLVLGTFTVMIAGFFGMMFMDEDALTTGNVAVIDVNGVITTATSGTFGTAVASSTTLVKLIEKASKDETIDAIVFMVNSPGGSAVASDEIALAVKEANKTTVAVIREMGTSGAYWIASATDHIIANKASFTG